MMDKKTLQDTAKKHVPAQHKGRNALIAFISGSCCCGTAVYDAVYGYVRFG